MRVTTALVVSESMTMETKKPSIGMLLTHEQKSQSITRVIAAHSVESIAPERHSCINLVSRFGTEFYSSNLDWGHADRGH